MKRQQNKVSVVKVVDEGVREAEQFIRKRRQKIESPGRELYSTEEEESEKDEEEDSDETQSTIQAIWNIEISEKKNKNSLKGFKDKVRKEKKESTYQSNLARMQTAYDGFNLDLAS